MLKSGCTNWECTLLKIIESGEFERLAGPRTSKVDVRVVASTNRGRCLTYTGTESYVIT